MVTIMSSPIHPSYWSAPSISIAGDRQGAARPSTDRPLPGLPDLARIAVARRLPARCGRDSGRALPAWTVGRRADCRGPRPDRLAEHRRVAADFAARPG